MLLTNPRSTERDNLNALRKYPFSDSASCTNNACTIPAGAIIDAQLYLPGRTPGRVWMSSIGPDGKLRFSDAQGECAELALPATPDAAVPVTFTGDGGPCPGGVVVFGREADVAALRALGGQRFTARQAELAPAAVSWPGLPGVLGFRLDDGHVVYGAVKIRGENGCVVATYTGDDGRGRLRISAVGRTVAAAETSGFVTRVVATSDNTNFVVNQRDVSGKVIDILMTGAATVGDDLINTDQDDLCGSVKRKTGTLPSPRTAAAPNCEDAACAPADTTLHKIFLKDSNGAAVKWTENASDYILVMKGEALGTLLSTQIAAAPPGKRFVGYFDARTKTAGTTLRQYYRYDGRGVGRFTLDTDITLYAHVIDAASRAEVTFQNYGTLHLAAPDQTSYTNPLRVSGQPNPVPVVHEFPDSALAAGGADALANLILHPNVPAGEVRLGLRGANKASLL